MIRKSRFLDGIFFGADLPGETLPGKPLVEIIGDKRVLIENHFGVTAYCDKEICVKTSLGCVCITGSELMLAQMTRQQLVIVGRVDGVHLLRGG